MNPFLFFFAEFVGVLQPIGGSAHRPLGQFCPAPQRVGAAAKGRIHHRLHEQMQYPVDGFFLRQAWVDLSKLNPQFRNHVLHGKVWDEVR